MKKFEHAERVWIAALEDDRDCVPVLANLGNMFRERHQYAPAVEVLDNALSVQPFNFQALHNRAVLALVGEWSMAAELSERASELKDDDACWHTLCAARLHLAR